MSKDSTENKSRSVWASLTKGRLIDITLLLATLTVVSYGVTLLYQQAYYDAFGIDTGAFNLSLAPELILNSAIIISGIMLIASFMYFYLWMLLRVRSLLDRHPYIVMDIMFAVIAIVCLALLIFPNALTIVIKEDAFLSSIPLYIYRSSFTALLVIAFLGFIVKFIFILKNKSKVSFRGRYLEVSKKLLPVRLSFKPLFTIYMPLWLPAVAILLIMLPMAPGQVAKQLVRDKMDFIAIVTDEKAEDKRTLVIGKNNEGLIVKTYNTKTKEFERGFSIMEAKDLHFEPYRIAKSSRVNK